MVNCFLFLVSDTRLDDVCGWTGDLTFWGAAIGSFTELHLESLSWCKWCDSYQSTGVTGNVAMRACAKDHLHYTNTCSSKCEQIDPCLVTSGLIPLFTITHPIPTGRDIYNKTFFWTQSTRLQLRSCQVSPMSQINQMEKNQKRNKTHHQPNPPQNWKWHLPITRCMLKNYLPDLHPYK